MLFFLSECEHGWKKGEWWYLVINSISFLWKGKQGSRKDKAILPFCQATCHFIDATILRFLIFLDSSLLLFLTTCWLYSVTAVKRWGDQDHADSTSSIKSRFWLLKSRLPNIWDAHHNRTWIIHFKKSSCTSLKCSLSSLGLSSKVSVLVNM